MKKLADWKQQAQTLETAGHRLAFWTANEHNDAKPWLLLIHGYPTSSWDWTFIWDELARHFRLAALDMLGFGLSDKPRNLTYSIFAQADLQEALLEHIGVSEAHILAHDYGDTVAQELLARHNDSELSFSIKSVVFLNGGLFPEQHRARPAQKLGLTPFGFILGAIMTRDQFRKTFDEIFGPETKASDAEIDAHWTLVSQNGGRRILHKLLNYIPERRENRARWVGALCNAVVPRRLIDGGADPVSGAHLYHHYRELVPSADAVILDSIGHYPQTEAPEAVIREVLEFHKRLHTVIA